jgi:uncharacterized protein
VFSLRKLICICGLFVTGLAVIAGPATALTVPAYKGYVNDYAKMLSPATESRLERALQSFELTDSTQIAVLTIDSLEGDSLEDFSIRTVDQWQIGQKGKDNGVLFLIVKKDRKMRIEVGKGLEGVLTDLMSGRIIDQVVAPLFKEGKFDTGIESGLAAIIQTTRGEFKADQLPPHRGRRGREPSPVLTYLFFGVMIISFLGRASKPLGVVAGAVLLPLIAFMGLSSIGLLAILLLVPIGAFGGLLLPLLFANAMMGRGGMYMGGGGFGGSGGGFGGFGGGGFGGGGASGGW